MDDSMRETSDVVFVTGTGRSGTNILKKILSTHSMVATLPFEYRFIIDPDGVVDFYNTFAASWSPYKADHSITRLRDFLIGLAELSDAKIELTEKIKSKDPVGLTLTPPPYSGWELNKWIPGYQHYVEKLIADLTAFEYSALWPGTKSESENNEMRFQKPLSKSELQPIIEAFLQSCFKAICADQQKSVFLEDNTHNLLFAEELFELVPNSKMVHVYRDPRDVISSLKTQKWAPRELAQTLEWYASILDQWLDKKKSLPADRVLEIRFEELIAKPESTIQLIMDFTGLPIETVTEGIDLSKSNTGRYKTELSADELDMVESRLENIISHYNY